MKFYQKLNEADLVVVKDIAMAKRFGQGSDTLAWFWRIGPSKDSLTGEWMEECELVLFTSQLIYSCLSLVYRVNWLRAKSRVDRWVEEEILVKNKMHWTILWFQNQVNLWSERSTRQDNSLTPGHKSYAIKQQKLWNMFREKATERFSIYLPFASK